MTEPTKTVATDDLVDKIQKLAGVNFLKLPVGSAFMWFGTVDVKDGVTTQGKPMMFVPGMRSPLDRTFMIIAIYRNETEGRVYCVPTEDAEKEEHKRALKEGRPFDPNALRPKRYELTKISPTAFVEQMPDATFQSEIAAELIELRESTTLPEDLQFEKIECEECEEDNDHDASFCKACGASLEEVACEKCGETVDDDDKYCSSCGESLEEEEEGAATASEPEKETPEESSAETEKSDDDTPTTM